MTHSNDIVLVTGAGGFLGRHVLIALAGAGFTRIRCIVKSTNALDSVKRLQEKLGDNIIIEVVEGTLLSRSDCERSAEGVSYVLHLAAGTGTKSHADAFLNSVVTTRNLIDACIKGASLKRFVNVSSFSVYSNCDGNNLTESSEVEPSPHTRAEAYCYGKVKQDLLVAKYVAKNGFPAVTLRPGVIFGPGKHSIPGRVGIDTFGVFLHFGGSNRIPFTYVANCAEALVLTALADLKPGEVFNILDDELPTSREFLRAYKKNVRSFRSFFVPHWASYTFCAAWEWASRKSDGQLPAAFTRREWEAYWKKTKYSNAKAKSLLNWKPRVPMDQALELYFDDCRRKLNHA